MPRKKTTRKVTKPRGRRGFMPKKHKDPEFVTMNLAIKHSRISGIYGPGENVQVPFDLAREFTYEEQCFFQSEERLKGTRAMLVLGRGRTKQVPVEAFESGLASEFENPSNKV